MKITVNGERRNLEQPASLLGYLQSLQLPSLDRGIAVCINGEVVRRSEWDQRRILSGDELEIVQATQGG